MQTGHQEYCCSRFFVAFVQSRAPQPIPNLLRDALAYTGFCERKRPCYRTTYTIISYHVPSRLPNYSALGATDPFANTCCLQDKHLACHHLKHQQCLAMHQDCHGSTKLSFHAVTICKQWPRSRGLELVEGNFIPGEEGVFIDPQDRNDQNQPVERQGLKVLQP